MQQNLGYIAAVILWRIMIPRYLVHFWCCPLQGHGTASTKEKPQPLEDGICIRTLKCTARCVGNCHWSAESIIPLAGNRPLLCHFPNNEMSSGAIFLWVNAPRRFQVGSLITRPWTRISSVWLKPYRIFQQKLKGRNEETRFKGKVTSAK